MNFLLTVALCAIAGLSRAQDGTDKVQHQDIVDSVAFPAGAVCNNGTPAYFYIENVGIDDAIAKEFKDVSEDTCLAMCTDSKDIHKNQLLCASVTYQLSTQTCRINRRQAVPKGTENLKDLNGTNYYEKFCLTPKAPVTCGEAIFPRISQAVLVGSPLSLKKVKDIGHCASLCTETPTCQSAMFYQNGSECIMNNVSAITETDRIQPETKEKVEYFENGCRDQVKEVLRKVKALSVSKTVKTDSKTSDPFKVGRFARIQQNLGSENFSPWTDYSECDTISGFKFRTRKCLAKVEDKCKGKLVEATVCGSASDAKESNGNGDGWGSWSTVCTRFPNECLGVQKRVCKGPKSQCTGPSSKYCFPPGCSPQ